MSNLFEKFHDVVDEFYLLTHVGFSQFDIDADELDSAINHDLFEDSSELIKSSSQKTISRTNK